MEAVTAIEQGKESVPVQDSETGKVVIDQNGQVVTETHDCIWIYMAGGTRHRALDWTIEKWNTETQRLFKRVEMMGHGGFGQ